MCNGDEMKTKKQLLVDIKRGVLDRVMLLDVLQVTVKNRSAI